MGGASEFRFPPYPSTPAEGGVLTEEERVAEDIRFAVYKISRQKLEKMKLMAEEIKNAAEKKITSQEMERETLEKMIQKAEEREKLEAEETTKTKKEKKAEKQKTESGRLKRMKQKLDETKNTEEQKTEKAEKDTKSARKKPAAYRTPLPSSAVLWPVDKPYEWKLMKGTNIIVPSELLGDSVSIS